MNQDLCLTTTEMHTGGEAVRIVESGWPELEGQSVLDKRRCALERYDHLRRFLMFEPRGHYDMYGALLVKPDLPEADFGVLFMHNEGYSTMCGHAVIALGRYAIDKGLVKTPTEPETEVKIQCPCGLVRAFVEYSNGKTGAVRFHSVPAFAYALDVEVEVEGHGKVKVDIGYGGAFYAVVSADVFGLDVRTSPTIDITRVADAVSAAVKSSQSIVHPDDPDLSFLYGTILTDGKDAFSQDDATANICVFANKEVDRSPTGSGVTARIAVQFARGLIEMGQTRTFQSGTTGSRFTGKVHAKVPCGEFQAVVVEVAGRGHYTGKATFTREADDELGDGFLLR